MRDIHFSSYADEDTPCIIVDDMDQVVSIL